MKREPIRWPTQWVVRCISALAVVCVVSMVLAVPAQAQTITDSSVTTAALADNAVTEAKIADGALTAAKINLASAQLSGTELNRIIIDRSLQTEDFAVDSVDRTPPSYGAVHFLDKKVVAGVEVAGTVVDDTHLANGAVGSSDIATNAVGSAEIRDRNIGTFHIADGEVTAEKLDSAANFATELQRELAEGMVFLGATRAEREASYMSVSDDIKDIVEEIVADVKAGNTLDVTAHSRFSDLAGTEAESVLASTVRREVAVSYQISNTDGDTVVIPTATVADPGATPEEIADLEQVNEQAKRDAYRAGSLRGQASYLAERIGLDPDEDGSNDADATLTARLNYAADIVEGNQGLLADTLPDADVPTTEVEQNVFEAANAVKKYQYLADRIGLELDEEANAAGTVQARVNDLKERIGSSGDTIPIDTSTDPDNTAVEQSDYDDASVSVYARSNYWKDRVDGAQTETTSLIDEFGERTDQIAGYEGSAALTNAVALPESTYRDASVGARANYLADRIGLNSGAAGSRTGTLTEQTNYLREKTGSDEDIIAGLTEGDVEAVSQNDYRDATVHARANYLADRIGLDPDVAGDKEGSLTARLNYLDDEIGGDEDQIMVPAGMDPDGNPIADVNGNPVLTAISGDDVNDGTDGSRANALDLTTFLGNNLNARANWYAARVGLNRDVAGNRNGNLQAQNNWVSDEIGRSANYIPTHNGFAAAQNALDIADYQDSTVRAQHNYWRDRIGLDPDALPNRYGRVQEQVNWLIDQADRIQRAAAMTGSLRDAHIPPGHRGGASFTFADYNGEIGYSMSLASIMGTRSKMTMSFASTENTEESLFRFGYDISW